MSKVVLDTYHGTGKEVAVEIIREGFKVISKEVTNDLGTGIYTFCRDDYQLWDPIRNAKRYAEHFKNKTGKVTVLKVTIDTSNNVFYVDLDDINFRKRWEQIRGELEKRANEIWKKYHRGNAKRRHNIDGILLELAINRHLLGVDNPDFVVKCTYTSFISKSVSNFPNGRELVIRNLRIIKNISEVS